MKIVMQPAEELHFLREKCQVMKNILQDIVENEGYLGNLPIGEPDNITARKMATGTSGVASCLPKSRRCWRATKPRQLTCSEPRHATFLVASYGPSKRTEYDELSMPLAGVRETPFERHPPAAKKWPPKGLCKPLRYLEAWEPDWKKLLASGLA